MAAKGASSRLDDTGLGRGVSVFVSGVALLGGAVLLAMAALIAISVSGRSLVWAGLSPVPGDYELVEVGCAFAVFSFLGWAHLVGGHARIGLLTDRLPHRARVALAVVADVLMAAIALFLAWRLALGLGDKMAYSETTVILRLPLWWAYAGAMLGAMSFVVSALYVLARTLLEGDQQSTGAGLAL